jgi:hypothetical protein
MSPYLDWLYAVTQRGFYEVNDVRGIMIALVGVFVMTNIRRFPVILLGCLAADLFVRIMGPVIVNKSPLVLPPIVEASFWQGLLSLLLGYAVVVLALYLIKSLLLRLFNRGGGHAYGH